MPPKNCFMFTAVWEGDRKKLKVPAGIGSNDEAARLRPGMLLDNTQDYVFWAYAANRDTYPSLPHLERSDGRHLQQVVQTLIKDRHPGLVRLVAESDPSTVAPVVIRSMAPVEPWETTNVTLIGDAIQNMTPMAGIGANTALRDASLLCRKLVEVDRGQSALLPTIHEYEAEMLEYGFAAVRQSLRNAQQAKSSSKFGRTAFKTVLRAINAVPPLRRQMARGLGT